MIATRPANAPRAEKGPRVGLTVTSVVVRLLLLACAGIVIQLGWIMVWTLSYHLTHGNSFTYAYLETQPAVWERLQDLLLLANALAPGLELPEFQGPVSRDIIVNSLVMAFVVTGVGYLGAIMLI